MGAPRVEGDRPTGVVEHSQDEAASKVVQFQGQCWGFEDNVVMATVVFGVVVVAVVAVT